MQVRNRPPETGPVVFVSYSHEGLRHSKRVESLVSRLRDDLGYRVRFDQYDEASVGAWPQWIRKQIRESDYVLMVFTRTYRRRFDGMESTAQGRGVAFEGRVSTNTLYAAAAAEAKFVPIVFEEARLEHVPRDIFSGTAFIVPRDWDRLVRHLKGTAGKQSGSDRKTSKPPVRSISDGTPPALRRANGRAFSVLFVGAEKGTSLDLHGQLRQTQAAIDAAKYRHSVRLSGIFDVTPDKMIWELGRRSPDALHLSTKGSKGLVLMHDAKGQLSPISADLLADLLRDCKDRLRLVVLDTCHSLPQARRIAETIDCAVGVEGSIADPVAIDFFANFYNSLANGNSIRRAFDIALGLERAKIEGDARYRRVIEDILEEDFSSGLHLPRLVVRRGLEAEKIFLVSRMA